MTDFGRAVAPLLLKRIYVPGPDMGTDIADVRHMLQSIGMRIKRRDFRSPHGGYYTALTVFTGAKRAIKHLGLELSECKIAIEGFGKVGSEAAKLFCQAGACITAISTSRGAIFNPIGLNLERLCQLAAKAGSRVVDLYEDAERIDRAKLLELPVHLLCPCARHNSIHNGNADHISARIICAGANHPITPDAEKALSDRGILCLPYFVTNCGGVLGGTMEFAGASRKKIGSFIEEEIGTWIARLLEKSTKEKLLPSAIAAEFALSRLRRIQENASRPSLMGGFFEGGLELYRRGWIPGFIGTWLSSFYFKKKFTGCCQI